MITITIIGLPIRTNKDRPIACQNISPIPPNSNPDPRAIKNNTIKKSLNGFSLKESI